MSLLLLWNLRLQQEKRISLTVLNSITDADLRNALPDINSEVRLPGIKTEIQITRDQYGIPHIKAESSDDAFFGQGFATAQDRLWHMESDRRRAYGTWAELVGEKEKESDIMMRKFQYLGIHYVDIIYYATRAVPLRVMAVGQKNYLSSKGIDVYDSIQVVIEWKMSSKRTFTSSFFTNWIDSERTSAMSDQKIKVIGTKGRYEADQKMRGIKVVTDEGGIEEPNPDFCSAYGFRKGEIMYQGYGIESVKQFLSDVTDLECGKAKRESFEGKRPTFKNALVSTAVLETANKSLGENGAWLDMSVEP